MLTDIEKKFVESAKYYEQLKEKLDEVRTEMDASLLALGIGTLVQDPETLTVYKVVKPQGRFIYYHDLDYVRTAQDGERAGSLSKKEAEALGFVLKK